MNLMYIVVAGIYIKFIKRIKIGIEMTVSLVILYLALPALIL